MLERFKVPDTDKVYIQSDKIFELTKNILKDLGVSDEGASNSASVLIENDLRGVESHGVSNGLRLYIKRYLDGTYNPKPKMKILKETPTTAKIDGDNALGTEIGPIAMQIAIDKAKKYGMGSVSVINTGHLAGCGFYALQAAQNDMVGHCYTGSPAGQTLPTWGSEPILGTNPVAWAAPANDMPAFLFDIATSQVAGNKIELTRRTGAKLLPAWIADKSGNPIMDEIETPDKGEYNLLPFGGTRENGSHKGYGLGLVAEIMSNILSGAGPGLFNDHQGSDYFAAYSVDAFTDVKKFKDDMDLLLKKIIDSKPAKGFDRVVYAGYLENEEFTERSSKGIPYHKEVIDWFRSYCSESEVDFNLD